MTRAVLLDIEGTVSSLTAVRDRLFPYARARLGTWAAMTDDPEVAAVISEVRQLAHRPAAAAPEIADILREWSDADSKAAPLKTMQGLIWRDGFQRRELRAELYPDVAPAMRRWHGEGISLYSFSSGSALAQRLWFSHTPYGDLSALLSGYFDTRNAGPKRDRGSYDSITRQLGIPPETILFLSDATDELDAAAEAGWEAIQVRRPDCPPATAGRHAAVGTFEELIVQSLCCSPAEVRHA
jgi:enolase-phosphatase E1